MGLMKRMRRDLQTRTEEIRKPAARRDGTAAAYRRAAALFLMTQFLLWVSLTGILQAGRTLWQAALLLIPAGAGVWWVSRLAWAEQTNAAHWKTARKGKSNGGSAATKPNSRPTGLGFWLLSRLLGIDSRPASASRSRQRSDDEIHPEAPSRPGLSVPRPWETLLLLPCVLADAVCILHALLAILARLMPSYPVGILRVCIPVLLVLGVLLGRRNGTACGVSLWRWLLPLLAVWVLVHVLRDQGTEQLYPLFDWKATGSAWGTGLGSLWAAGLVYLLPECRSDPLTGKPSRTMLYVLLPLLLGCLCALGLSVCGAWRVNGEPDGYRLLFAGRSSGSIMVSGLWALFWLLSLMTAFATSLMLGQKLLLPLFPRWNGRLPVLLVWLPAFCLQWLWQDALPSWLIQLLPFRLALWAGAAAWALIRKNRKKRNSRTL